MTIVTFLQAFKSALEWAVNSKFVFAVISIIVFVTVLRTFGGFIWRFARDNFIFERRKRNE